MRLLCCEVVAAWRWMCPSASRSLAVGVHADGVMLMVALMSQWQCEAPSPVPACLRRIDED